MSQNQKFFPNYTVGPDAYEAIESVCSRYGTKAVAIGGKRALAAAKPYLEKALKDSSIEIIAYEWYGGEASLENSEMLMNLDSYKQADMVFAFGGGKAIDTCKYASLISGKPFFTFPTIAATCAPASAEAIMYYPNGEARDTYECHKPAIHVFINTEIIAKAPDIYLWAGIGDTMAKHFETSLAARDRKDLSFTQALGVEVGTMCYRPLVQYGAKAIADCKADHTSAELEQIVLTNIITTGIVSGCVGVTINSNIAHALCYGLTILPQIEKKNLHGEIVSYCTLVLLMIDGQTDKVDELYPLYKAINLPTKLSDLEVKREELDPVIEKMLVVDDIKYVPYKVTKDMVYNAIDALEEYNKAH